MARRLFAAVALCLLPIGLQAAPQGTARLALPEPLDPQHPAHQAFRKATVQLLLNGQPRFELRYAGPPLQVRGTLCYRFAGYSETCRQARGQWVTGADPLVFLAPGQVPLDLLAGYRLEVRLPQTLEGVFQYDPAPPARKAALRRSRANNGEPGHSRFPRNGKP